MMHPVARKFTLGRQSEWKCWIPGCQSLEGRLVWDRGWQPETERAATPACKHHSRVPHGACATVP